MKNKEKYNLHELDWSVSRIKRGDYQISYITKIFLCGKNKAHHIATIQGGAHSDLFNWLESEVENESEN